MYVVVYEKRVNALCQRGRYVQWSEWSGAGLEDGKECVVLNRVLKRFHEQLQKSVCVRERESRWNHSTNVCSKRQQKKKR